MNFITFNKLFGYSNRIDVLHGNSKVGTKFRRPSFINVPFQGALSKNLTQILRINNWPTFYFPNGVFISDINHKNKVPEDYYIYIGRITPEKGVEMAIQFARRAGERLIIFGWVQDHTYFREQVSSKVDGKNIIFMGEQPWKVVENFLVSSKALLFMSTYDDPQPTVLMEALSNGVPVIGLKPGYYSGFYDMCNKSNSIVGENIEQLLNLKQGLDNLSRDTIRSQTVDNWAWENVIKKIYLPIIEKLRNTTQIHHK